MDDEKYKYKSLEVLDDLFKDTIIKLQENSKVKENNLINNNILLDKLFQDTILNNPTHEKNTLNNPGKTNEEFLNELFNETVQSKIKYEGSLFNRQNPLDDSHFNPKEEKFNKISLNNDIFKYLDDQSDIHEDEKIGSSQQKKDSNILFNDLNHEKTNQNSFFKDNDPLKTKANYDINFDIDQMLMELNMNINQCSDNVKDTKDIIKDSQTTLNVSNNELVIKNPTQDNKNKIINKNNFFTENVKHFSESNAEISSPTDRKKSNNNEENKINLNKNNDKNFSFVKPQSNLTVNSILDKNEDPFKQNNTNILKIENICPLKNNNIEINGVKNDVKNDFDIDDLSSINFEKNNQSEIIEKTISFNEKSENNIIKSHNNKIFESQRQLPFTNKNFELNNSISPVKETDRTTEFKHLNRKGSLQRIDNDNYKFNNKKNKSPVSERIFEKDNIQTNNEVKIFSPLNTINENPQLIQTNNIINTPISQREKNSFTKTNQEIEYQPHPLLLIDKEDNSLVKDKKVVERVIFDESKGKDQTYINEKEALNINNNEIFESKDVIPNVKENDSQKDPELNLLIPDKIKLDVDLKSINKVIEPIPISKEQDVEKVILSEEKTSNPLNLNNKNIIPETCSSEKLSFSNQNPESDQKRVKKIIIKDEEKTENQGNINFPDKNILKGHDNNLSSRSNKVLDQVKSIEKKIKTSTKSNREFTSIETKKNDSISSNKLNSSKKNKNNIRSNKKLAHINTINLDKSEKNLLINSNDVFFKPKEDSIKSNSDIKLVDSNNDKQKNIPKMTENEFLLTDQEDNNVIVSNLQSDKMKNKSFPPASNNINIDEKNIPKDNNLIDNTEKLAQNKLDSKKKIINLNPPQIENHDSKEIDTNKIDKYNDKENDILLTDQEDNNVIVSNLQSDKMKNKSFPPVSNNINIDEKNIPKNNNLIDNTEKLAQNKLDCKKKIINLNPPQIDNHDSKEIDTNKIDKYNDKQPENKLPYDIIKTETSVKGDRIPNNNVEIPNDKPTKITNYNDAIDKPKKIKLDYRRDTKEKFYGKIVIGKEYDHNLKLKKDFIFADKFFTALNNAELEICFIGMPEYFTVKEDVLNSELKIINATLTKCTELRDLKMKLDSFSINDKEKSINFRSLYNIDDIGYFAGLSECAIYLKEVFKDCVKFSILKADGNNFYRSFMFALLEYYILKNKILEIKRISLDFWLLVDLKFNRNNEIIDKKLCLAIFKLIIDYLSNKDSKNAYLTFCKAVILFPNFDLGLIKYMRIAIGKFIDTNNEIIYNDDNYQIIDFLCHSAYKTDKEKTLNIKGFIEENIFSMQNEAEQLLYYLSPIVFNINLDLYLLEGSLNNDPNNARFLRKIIQSQNTENKEIITLLYRLTHFDILYTNNIYTENKEKFDSIPITEITQSKTRIKELSSLDCEKCKKQSIVLKVLDESIDTTCKYCMNSFIKDKMMERVKNYIAENYNNLEFYCRPMNLSNEILLYDEDFLILTGKTITQYLFSILDGLCESCILEFDQKDFHILECFCKVCRFCLIKKIKLSTDDLVIYNSYEQKLVKIKAIACFCYNEFNYINAVNTFTEAEMMEYINASNDRFTKQALKICMECESTLSKDQSNKEDKESRVNIKIEMKNQKTIDHILCLICFKKLKSNEKDKTITALHCNLCDTPHKIDPKIWEIKVSKEKKCCDCIIF